MTLTDIERQINYLNYKLQKRPTLKDMKRLENLRLEHEQLIKGMVQNE